MDKFSIEECKILWFKDAKITKEQKQAIKNELKTMSEIVADALHFIEGKERSNGREVIVRIWFNSREIENYQLQIDKGWTIDIITFRDDVDSVEKVGNIVSEKWSIEIIFEDTCYDPPDQI